MITVLDNGGKTCDQYCVIIDRDIWFMSSNANMPNGVCMYGGNTSEYETRDLGTKIAIDDLPEGTKKQIDYIMLKYFS